MKIRSVLFMAKWTPTVARPVPLWALRLLAVLFGVPFYRKISDVTEEVVYPLWGKNKEYRPGPDPQFPEW